MLHNEIVKCRYINLKDIAESGQCFRWKRYKEASYIVVSDGKAAIFEQMKKGICIRCEKEDLAYFYSYLDMSTSYGSFCKKIDAADSYLKAACEAGKGIRILRQNVWEMVISFIISQRNNIPRIIHTIEKMCETLGEPIDIEDGVTKIRMYAFPTPDTLAKADLSPFKLGYREKYIKTTASAVESGEIDLEKISRMRPQHARDELKKINGVGEKVAACIALFGLHHLNAFPVDTWIQKVEERHYEGHFPIEKYDKCAGIMQQYMFFYERKLEKESHGQGPQKVQKQLKSQVPQKIEDTQEKTKKAPAKNTERDKSKNKANLRSKTLYISDLDGTFLNKDAQVDENVKNKLNTLIAQGVDFTVATARTYATVNRIMEGIDLRHPIILMNGVMLYDPSAKKCIHAWHLKQKTFRYILEGMRKYNVTGFVYSIHEGHMNTWFENIETEQMEKFYEDRLLHYDKPFRKIERFEQLIGEDIIYISISYEKKKLDPFYEYLKKEKDVQISFYKDVYGEDMWYLELSDVHASKYHAVTWLRKELKPDRVVVFGDNMNDLPMFEASDYAVAVSNAKEEVKEQADMITTSNEEGGVVNALESLCCVI